MKKIFVFLFILLILLGISYWIYTSYIQTPKKNVSTETTVDLACDNGYTMTIRYSEPDAKGVMMRMNLAVVFNGEVTVYDMYPSLSGSGAKFETKDRKHSMWEHQGTFTFSVNDTDTAVCREKITTIENLTEADARAIAEATCIKSGESLSAGSYNENTKTWWFDANLKDTKQGCNPACVVSEETGTAEINWRCTGLSQPQ